MSRRRFRPHERRAVKESATHSDIHAAIGGARRRQTRISAAFNDEAREIDVQQTIVARDLHTALSGKTAAARIDIGEKQATVALAVHIEARRSTDASALGPERVQRIDGGIGEVELNLRILDIEAAALATDRHADPALRILRRDRVTQTLQIVGVEIARDLIFRTAFAPFAAKMLDPAHVLDCRRTGANRASDCHRALIAAHRELTLAQRHTPCRHVAGEVTQRAIHCKAPSFKRRLPHHWPLQAYGDAAAPSYARRIDRQTLAQRNRLL